MSILCLTRAVWPCPLAEILSAPTGWNLLPASPGTNACYVEAASRVKTLPEGYNSNTDLMCINTEWGNFSAPCLPRLEEDLCALWSCARAVRVGPYTR